MHRKGAIGALLDVYENALTSLGHVVATIPDSLLTEVIDPHTTSPNCRSFQQILSHVVHCGHGYATYIHNLKGPQCVMPGKIFHETTAAYLTDLRDIITATENILAAFADDELEQLDDALKIKVSWGQLYDIEQLMEHAIVHVLRHQRQVEKLLALQ